jgi:hypothetical protein
MAAGSDGAALKEYLSIKWMSLDGQKNDGLTAAER